MTRLDSRAMRTTIVVCALVTSSAHADSHPVVALGVTADYRMPGPSFSYERVGAEQALVGPRLVLSFEQDPLSPPAHGTARQGRIVPELVAGVLANEAFADGYVGAGLRAEVALANRSSTPQRGVI